MTEHAHPSLVPATFEVLALYNITMNARVYDVAAQIPDAERKRDMGAYFKSVHGTLNHLLYGDWGWMNRLAGTSYEMPPIGTELFDDFDALRNARVETDDALSAWVAELDGAWLAGSTTWASTLDKVDRTQPNWFLLTHLFNHQTHHRGQLTTLLTQLGHDVGITDLPRLVLQDG